MTAWFGKPWGPACDPREHFKTPVGKPCIRCVEPIVEGDQGLITPLVEADGSASVCFYHLDCFLEGILPHGADCERCRGRQPYEHDEGCAHRRRQGERCNCSLTTSLPHVN